ncbi:MAG TPA: hypothetical protein PKA06_02865, partial [Gemmatales bacterium]|nr:hypothetical protein [Gemmatales bacterium]
TFWVLQHQPAADCRLRRLHALTAGRLYWLLPVVMLLWANLDGWFFLGLIIIAGGLMSTWLEAAKDNDGDQKRKSLLYATVLSVIATLVTPFHYHSFVEIPNRLMPATGQELFARWEEMKKTIPNVKMSEQLRFYASPVTAPFFDNVRAEQLATLNQAPFLGMFYPMGLSISEWAFYPLLVLLVVALLLGISTAGASRLLLLALFIGLGLWQHRLVGFFVAGGVTLAVLLFQSTTPGEPFLSRPAVLGKQLVCLLIGLVIQCCTLLHLVPS